MMRLRQQQVLLLRQRMTTTTTTTTTTTPKFHQQSRMFVSKAEKRVLTQQQVDGPKEVPKPAASPTSKATTTNTAAAKTGPPTEEFKTVFWQEYRVPLAIAGVTVVFGGVAFWLRFYSGIEMFQRPGDTKPAPIVDQQHYETINTSAPVVAAPDDELDHDEDDEVEAIVLAAAQPLAASSASKETPSVDDSQDNAAGAAPVTTVAATIDVPHTPEKEVSPEPASPPQAPELTPEPVSPPLPPAPVIVIVEKETVEPKEVPPVGNRVVSIAVPPADPNRPASVVPIEPAHPEGGNRVFITILPEQPTAKDAAQELDDAIHEEAVLTIQRAQQALRSTLDETWLQDLDQLTPTQLRIRVVQLAKELEERTKWEAVRLKEFLAMKESETADRYKQVLQQQRENLESLLSRRLSEQSEELSKKHQAALEEKEQGIQKAIQEVVDAQNTEHQAQLERLEVEKEREVSLKYQTEYANQLQALKLNYIEELTSKLEALEALTAKLQELEVALETSRTFKIDSLKAHRLSAAALAFAEKLETSKSAAHELELLKAAAEDNGVIVSAVAALPKKVVEGVPTLSELQTRYETVHRKGRQAALIPAGRVGLDGQFLGKIFATLKTAPNPDEPAPEEAKDSAEYILARTRRHVQLGDLEHAVEELNKLPSTGQVAFTVKDWKEDALERIAVNKALRSIKLECALLNSSISSGTSSSSEDLQAS